MDSFADIYISSEAMRAIDVGVKRGDSLADLEILGLPQRVINILEDSDYKIVKLSQLVKKSREELMAISCLGEVSVRSILEVLAKYHTLEAAIKEEEDSLTLRTVHNEFTKERQLNLRQLQNASP